MYIVKNKQTWERLGSLFVLITKKKPEKLCELQHCPLLVSPAGNNYYISLAQEIPGAEKTLNYKTDLPWYFTSWL